MTDELLDPQTPNEDELYLQEGEDLFGAEPAPAPVAVAEPTAVAENLEPSELLALYRRYRPDSFSQVIGQEHVTEPLQRALNNNKIAHAYLFSGPRGCGKTTSARILARCLNCEQGPTATPCGVCRSCQELATGGPGSIDVIEIDAASHGGVDDARELRERAFFAPVQSRYKVYIIDEAHMVTSHGFNALLKVIEEPPAHVKFIFATTEPDKVLGTIRSRTHHYPFRLVPPKVMASYLEQICNAEKVQVEPAVYPLVVRSGGGSVRDSLSLLDQLIGGASEDGVTYSQASALLGFTPDVLLDEVIDGFAAHDAKAVYQGVDKIIEIGQDPRRFAQDLLDRFRDLVIIAGVPDALSTGLIDVPTDQGERLANQAKALGQAELTRAAQIVADGLSGMRGTTTPRLLLELICSRILLPGSRTNPEDLATRLDQLARKVTQLSSGMPVSNAASGSGAPVGGSAQTSVSPVAEHNRAAGQPVIQQTAAVGRPTRPAMSGGMPSGQTRPTRPMRPVRNPNQNVNQSVSEQNLATPAAQPSPTTASRGNSPVGNESSAGANQDVAGLLNQRWSQIVDLASKTKRSLKTLLENNSKLVGVSQEGLTLSFSNSGALKMFNSGCEQALRGAIREILGIDLAIKASHDPNISIPINHSANDELQPSRQSYSSPAEPMPMPEEPKMVPPQPDMPVVEPAQPVAADSVVTEAAEQKKAEPENVAKPQAVEPEKVAPIPAVSGEDFGSENPDQDLTVTDPAKMARELVMTELNGQPVDEEDL